MENLGRSDLHRDSAWVSAMRSESTTRTDAGEDDPDDVFRDLLKPRPPCARLDPPVRIHKNRTLLQRARWRGFTISLFQDIKHLSDDDFVYDGKRLEVTRGKSVVCRHHFSWNVPMTIGSTWNCWGDNTDVAIARYEKDNTPDNRESAEELRRMKRALRWLRVGQDFTGNGSPNLVVFENPGGSSGVFVIHVFELGDRCRKVLSRSFVPGGGAASASVVDLDHDGVPELLDTEVFEKPDLEGGFKIFGRVILKLSRGRYRASVKLMRKPPWPSQKFLREARKIHGSKAWGSKAWPRVPFELAQAVVDLIYSGNAAQAKELIAKAWNSPAKKWRSFYRELSWMLSPNSYYGGSKYWKALRRLNRGKL